MHLTALADVVDRLEQTRSRRQLVELVAGLLRGASRDERAPLVYLLQAQLRPPYEGVEIGVGEKLLIDAIASATGAARATVARRFAALGDLGSVAEALLEGHGGTRVTVRDAYETLLGVARAAGVGSQERKVSSLAALLRRVRGREAKLIVRVAQGRLRLGVGDQTIIEATARAALGDSDAKQLVEDAYNVRSDLGHVVALAFEKGKRALVGIGPTVGIPVRPALAQRLPSSEEIVARLGRVQVEPKYDGFRLQLHREGRNVWAFSRRLEDVTAMFPELTAAALRQLTVARAILEGEALAYQPDTGEFLPFQVTMTRKRKLAVSEAAERYPLRFIAFDVLLAGQRNMLPVPQRVRSARLERLIRHREDAPLVVTERLVTDDPAKVQAYFEEMIHRGLEGIVAKRPDAPYRAGARGFDWVKLKRAYQSKLRDTIDVVVVGYLVGKGKRSTLGIGSLLAAVYDARHDRFRTVAKIGSGLRDEAWRSLRKILDADRVSRKPRNVDSQLTPDVWVTPRVVLEVLADEITRSPFHTCGKSGDESGYALRFPRVVHGVRTDKGPTDATTEQEVLSLFRQQHAGRKVSRRKAARRGDG